MDTVRRPERVQARIVLIMEHACVGRRRELVPGILALPPPLFVFEDKQRGGKMHENDLSTSVVNLIDPLPHFAQAPREFRRVEHLWPGGGVQVGVGPIVQLEVRDFQVVPVAEPFVRNECVVSGPQ